MNDFQSAPRLVNGPPNEGRAIETLSMAFIGALIVAALYVGRQIFLPIAIAVLLSFVLAPPIRLLRRWKLGRIAPVLLVVALAFAAIFGTGAILARQVTQLADDLPRYQQTIAHKIESVRGAASEATFVERASGALKSLGDQLSRSRQTQEPAKLGAPQAAAQQNNDVTPIPVEVHQPPSGPFEVLETVIATVLEPLATTGIIAVFVIFILLQREDLRDRVIRLAGSQDLQRTTAALDDAATRLSRFFLVQTGINFAFGVIVGVGLSIIGVPSAILWGIMAMFMRFVPYIGAIVAAAFPLALAAAVDPGWSMVIATALLFVIGEPIMGQVVEPWLYGHSTGLSPIAVVIAATFWTWLWGPVGLLLATPLTVCLVVLGRHVERLEFLDVLLGDAPPLTPSESFYQRVLGGHASEAAEQAEKFLKSHALADYFDEIALPGLLMAQKDVRRGNLDPTRQEKILGTVEEVIDDLEDTDDGADKEPSADEEAPAALSATYAPAATSGKRPVLAKEELAPEWQGEGAVLCVAGRTPLDEAAAMMLSQLLRKHGIDAAVAPSGILAPSGSQQLRTRHPALICLSYLDADLNAAHVRFAVRRLRRAAPQARILAGFWSGEGTNAKAAEWCDAARADYCETTMAAAIDACLKLARGDDPKADAKPAAALAPVVAA